MSSTAGVPVRPAPVGVVVSVVVSVRSRAAGARCRRPPVPLLPASRRPSSGPRRPTKSSRPSHRWSVTCRAWTGGSPARCRRAGSWVAGSSRARLRHRPTRVRGRPGGAPAVPPRGGSASLTCGVAAWRPPAADACRDVLFCDVCVVTAASVTPWRPVALAGTTTSAGTSSNSSPPSSSIDGDGARATPDASIDAGVRADRDAEGREVGGAGRGAEVAEHRDAATPAPARVDEDRRPLRGLSS